MFTQKTALLSSPCPRQPVGPERGQRPEGGLQPPSLPWRRWPRPPAAPRSCGHPRSERLRGLASGLDVGHPLGRWDGALSPAVREGVLDRSSLSSPRESSSTSRHTSLRKTAPGKAARPELGRGPQWLPCLVSLARVQAQELCRAPGGDEAGGGHSARLGKSPTLSKDAGDEGLGWGPAGSGPAGGGGSTGWGGDS